MPLTTFVSILCAIVTVFFHILFRRACDHADAMFSAYSSTRTECLFDGALMPAGELASCLLRQRSACTSVISNDSEYADSYIEPLDTIALSQTTFFGTGVSEVATAAHEVGHALGYLNRFSCFMLSIGSSASSTAKNLAKALALAVVLQIALIVFSAGSRFVEYSIVIIAMLMSVCELVGCAVSIESERDASEMALLLLPEHVSDRSMRGIRRYLAAALDTYLMFAPCAAFGVLAILFACMPVLL